MLKLIFKIILFISIQSLLFSNLHANISLNKQEKEFIKNHPTIHLAGGLSFEPFLMQNKDGSINGHDIELLDLIAKQSGLKFKVSLGNWSKIQKKALQRQYDGLVSSSDVKSRNINYNFSNPYIKFASLVITKKGNPKNIYSINDLEGKSVAIQKDNILFEKIIKDTGKNIKIISVDSMNEMFLSVVSEKVDFTVMDETVFYLAKQIGLYNSIETPFTVGKPFNVVFALRNDWPELTSIINKSLDSIPNSTKSKLRDKWFGENIKNKLNFKLTEEEKNYLQNKQQLNLCVDPDWLPYNKLEDGKYIGIGADLFYIVQTRLPIPLNIVKTTSWQETLQYAKDKKCDIVDFAIYTKERSEYLSFTSTYMRVPLVIATKINVPFISNFKTLKNKKIGVVREYAFLDLLKEKYPYANIVEVDSIEKGLKQVKDGKLFGYIGALATVAYEFKENFTGELKISGKFDEFMEMGSAVQKEDKILLNILQKIINSIEKNDITKIINKWISITHDRKIDYSVISNILLE